MLEVLGEGWTTSFLPKVYPGLSRNPIGEFVKVIMGLSIVVILVQFMTFRAENFIKSPAVLLTEGIQNFRLDGLLIFIATTHGKLGGLITLTHYPKQMREKVKLFEMKGLQTIRISFRILNIVQLQLLRSHSRETGGLLGKFCYPSWSKIRQLLNRIQESGGVLGKDWKTDFKQISASWYFLK